MEQDLGSESVPASGHIDKSRVLNVRPLRCLIPVFPSSSTGSSQFSTPQSSPFMCVPPTGPFPPGVSSFYPFFVSNESQRSNEQTPIGAANQAGPYGNSMPAPVPLNSFRTPVARNGDKRRRRSRNHTQQEGVVDPETIHNKKE